MGAAIGDVLPLALTIAIVPVSIITLILLLLSRRARTNATAFTSGRILGLAVVAGIALSVAAGQSAAADPGSSPVVSLIKVLLGIVLVLASVRRWQRHRKDSGEPSLPGWMQRLDEATPALSLVAGFLISALEPLTLVFAIDAGLSIAHAELPFASTLVVIAVFVLVATVTNTAILLIYLAGATRAEPKLTSIRGWINANHEALSIVLLFVLGAILIGRGVPGISA
jgi:threonine/homoserine/homoserine lactone efflux protein